MTASVNAPVCHPDSPIWDTILIMNIISHNNAAVLHHVSNHAAAHHKESSEGYH
jgi:hypothetical protein